MTPEEEIAVYLASTRDPEGLDWLYRQYSASVMGWCLRAVGNKPDADDISQDVWMKVHKHVGQFRGQAEFSTWLYRLAWHTIADWFHAKKRRSHEEPFDETVHAGIPDCREELEDILSRLRPQDRRMIEETALEGRSYAAVASDYNITESTLKGRLIAARSQARRVANEAQN